MVVSVENRGILGELLAAFRFMYMINQMVNIVVTHFQ